MELPDITEQHEQLLTEVNKALGTWRRFVIGIDGRDHAGKSTIGRFLALHMGMPLIETDLFVLDKNQRKDQEKVEYRRKELKRVIDARLNKDRPVIVEGIFLLRTLEGLGLKPDYLIYAVNEDHDGSGTRREEFMAYENEYKPRARADKQFFWQGE